MLGAEHGPGLMELLSAPNASGRYAPAPAGEPLPDVADEVSRAVREIQGLLVIPAGTTTREPADLVAGDRMRQILEELRGRFDIVLLAAPAATSSQGSEVCMAADATVLIVTERRTRATAVAEALERAARLGIRYIGLVALPRRLGSTTSRAGAHATPDMDASRASGSSAGPSADAQTPQPIAGSAGDLQGTDDTSANASGALAGARSVGPSDA